MISQCLTFLLWGWFNNLYGTIQWSAFTFNGTIAYMQLVTTCWFANVSEKIQHRVWHRKWEQNMLRELTQGLALRLPAQKGQPKSQYQIYNYVISWILMWIVHIIKILLKFWNRIRTWHFKLSNCPSTFDWNCQIMWLN